MSDFNPGVSFLLIDLDLWRQTTDLLREILEDRRKPPLDRLTNLVHAFLRSECAEAQMRVALSDAAPLYRDAPEAKEARATGERTMLIFLQEALPGHHAHGQRHRQHPSGRPGAIA